MIMRSSTLRFYIYNVLHYLLVCKTSHFNTKIKCKILNEEKNHETDQSRFCGCTIQLNIK